MKYPKINSLWKRKDRQDFIEGDYATPEFALIKKWLVQEKIDGTNIRIKFTSKPGQLPNTIDVESTFHGRNEDSQLPNGLIPVLQSIFTLDALVNSLGEYYKPGNCTLWLFGEGYGPKIQKGGGNYRKDMGFILFDVCHNGTWLSREDVQKFADLLEIPTPPIIGEMTEEEVVAYVKSNPLSLCSEKEQVMEGVICRTSPMLLFKDRSPLMMKLKCRDFK